MRDGATARPAFVLGAVLVFLSLAGAAFAPWAAPHDPFRIVGGSLTSPSAEYWLGTDALGRDIWSRILWGARTAWSVGLGVGAVATFLGLVAGLTAAMSRPVVDAVVMRVADVVLALPRFFLAIVVVALFGPGLDRIIWVLALTSWAGLARIVRAESLSLRERDFVLAARAAGASPRQIATGEILPNLVPTIVVLAGLLVGRAILTEAGLSFLGLGDPALASWGMMAGDASATLRAAWWSAAAPGGAIIITVLGTNLIGDAGVGAPSS